MLTSGLLKPLGVIRSEVSFDAGKDKFLEGILGVRLVKIG
jgi:hypothetical protein